MLKIIKRLFYTVIIAVVALFILLQFGFTQRALAVYVKNNVLEEYGLTDIQFERLKLGLNGKLYLYKLSVPDARGAHIVQLNKLKVKLGIRALLNKQIKVKSIALSGTQGSIYHFKGGSYSFSHLLPENTSKQEKEESDSKLSIEVQKVVLEDIQFRFHDSISQVFLDVDLGYFETNMGGSDINNLAFRFKKVLLKQTFVELGIDESLLVKPEDEPPVNQKLPTIDVATLKLTDVGFRLNDIKNNSYLETLVQNISGQKAYVDIADELVRVANIDLQNSYYIMDYTADTVVNTIADTIKAPSDRALTFSGGWTIETKQLSGANNKVALLLSASNADYLGFNSSNFILDNIDFKLTNTSVSDREISSSIEHVSCKDSGGFKLIDAAIDFTFTPNVGAFYIQKLKTERSEITGEVDVYLPLESPSLSAFTPQLIRFKGGVNIGELHYFLPTLQLNEYFATQENILLNMDLSGTADTIQLKHFTLQNKATFMVKGSADISNYKNLQRARLSAKVDTVYWRKASDFIATDLFLPDVGARFVVNGTWDSLMASYVMGDSKGSNIKGTAKLNNDSINSRFVCEAEVDNFNASNYFADSVVGNVDGNMHIEGVLEDKKLVNVSIKGLFDQIQIVDYELQKLAFAGQKSGEQLSITASVENNGLTADANANGVIKGDSLELRYYADVKEFSHEQLKDARADYSIALTANGYFSTSADLGLQINANIPTFSVDYKDKNYAFDPMWASFTLDSLLKNIKYKTKGIEFDVESNLEPEKIQDHLFAFVKRNLRVSGLTAVDSAYVFNARCKVESPYLLQEFLAAVLSDTISIDSLYFVTDLQNRVVLLKAQIPQIGYRGAVIKGLNTNLDIKNANLNWNLDINQIVRENAYTNRISVNANNNDGKIASKFSFYDQNNRVSTSVPIAVNLSDSLFEFGFNNDRVVIAYNQWNYSNNLAFTYDYKNRRWHSDGVDLVHGEERIVFEEEPNRVVATVENIQVDQSLNFVSFGDEKVLTGGVLTAYLALLQHEELDWVVESAVTVNDISLYNEPYGNMEMTFSQIDTGRFQASLSLINKADYFNYSGSFGERSDQMHKAEVKLMDITPYTFLIDTNKLNVKEGALDSKLTASKETGKYIVDGYAKLHNTLIHLPTIGAHYKIVDEEVTFSQSGVRLNKITVEDLAGNKLELTGTIGTRTDNALNLDLAIHSDYFQLLDTPVDRDKNIYGQLAIKADVNLKGTTVSPNLSAKIRVHKQTDLTLILPGDDPLQNSNEDIVRFSSVEADESDSLFIINSLTSVSDSIEAVINQGSFDILISFDPMARYKVITNPISGDYVFFGLNGALVYKTGLNGLTEVTGNIQFVDGLYEMSFYEMIRKQFIIEPSSSIYFSGPLSNTTVNLQAKNIVRTNSLALMSSESIGNSPEEKALYNQRLPYELLFNVDGSLLSPNISFALDLPQEHKQNSPMIASKLNKLATPEMEQELNMQVFALLVTGGFIAENTSVASGSGSSDVAATTARNSVNSILSQQLNKLTSDNIKYFDMNLGLNTYDDYRRGSSGTQTTDLDVQISKSLFDDRVSFEMESRINLDGVTTNPGQSSSNYNTDYKLFYNLNEKGNVRLKAYNLSIYDLFDGDITNTGVGITFSREFEGRKKTNYVELDSVQVND